MCVTSKTEKKLSSVRGVVMAINEVSLTCTNRNVWMVVTTHSYHGYDDRENDVRVHGGGLFQVDDVSTTSSQGVYDLIEKDVTRTFTGKERCLSTMDV
jgi:hypothetical protein